MRRWIWLVVLAVAAGQASGAVVEFADFADTASLTLSGSAATVTTEDGVVLRLTPAEGSQSGSAFNSVRISAAKFSTYFTFRITEPDGRLFDGNTKPGADGIVFVVQSVSSDIGGEGQGIGYEGIQLHGGIGMTDEHDIGFYAKRARGSELTFGDAAYHRDRFARLQGF